MRDDPSAASGSGLPDGWLAGLTDPAAGPAAGTAGLPDAAGAAFREGRLLRQLMQARARPADSASDRLAGQAHWPRVLARVQQEALWPATAPRRAAWWARWWAPGGRHRAGAAPAHPWRLAAGGLLAGLVVGGVLLHVLGPGPTPPDADAPQWRGDEASQRLVVAPQAVDATVAQVTAVLARHQLPYWVTRRAAGAVVQARVPPDSAAAAALRPLGVVVPAHGRLNLQVTSP